MDGKSVSAVLFTSVFFLCSLFGQKAHAQVELCGDPPPVSNEEIEGDIKGSARALSRFLGDAEFSGRLKRSRSEIFSKYENERERADAYLQYTVCIFLMLDDELTTIQKIQQMRDLQDEFQQPVSKVESSIQPAYACRPLNQPSWHAWIAPPIGLPQGMPPPPEHLRIQAEVDFRNQIASTGVDRQIADATNLRGVIYMDHNFVAFQRVGETYFQTSDRSDEEIERAKKDYFRDPMPTSGKLLAYFPNKMGSPALPSPPGSKMEIDVATFLLGAHIKGIARWSQTRPDGSIWRRYMSMKSHRCERI